MSAATTTSSPVESVLQTSPAANVKYEPIISKQLPFFRRMRIGARLWILKFAVFVALKLVRVVSRKQVREVAPSYSKSYEVQPQLPCRIFLPKSYKSGSKLPLYIDIHGGGFAICDPQVDDRFCRYFADHFGYCVVAINYRKAPLYPWPLPVEDCADLARAVLDDDDLPVDRNKVVMGGFSAGGNLCLCIAQLDGIRERIKALVPFYPAVDFSGQFRGEFKTNKQGKADMLKHSSALFNWGYVPIGIDRRHSLLSPIYASRTQLPQKIYMIGAEYDVLCQEANIMAKSLAGFEKDAEPGSLWEQNGIKWETISDVQHGFTHVPLRGAEGVRIKSASEELYKRVDEWLKKEIL